MRDILHLSDIHFGPPHLPAVAAGVLDLIERRRPDLVVISGDLTQRAKPRQFRAARAFVDRIEPPTIVVPGNHDVPMYRFWERLLAPYGAYRKHFSPELEPLFQDDELFVLGFNTAFNWTIDNGRITRRRIRQAAAQLAAAPVGRTRVAVIHHNFTPPPRFGVQTVLRNSVAAIEMLAANGVELILSGHLHQAFVRTSEEYYRLGLQPVTIVHSGTTTSSRGRGGERGLNTCNWLRIEAARVEIEQLLWNPTEGRFVERSRHRFPRPPRRPWGLATESP